MPHFILGGAPKCGTTSLHQLLAHHPAIRIPSRELHFFDADDPITHPHFFRSEGNAQLEWKNPDISNSEAWEWYQTQFTALGDLEGRSVGEDSTTYLVSEVAAARIHRSLPDVRLIFLLRHPVDRAYSEYWHYLNTGRISERFEDAIVRYPALILGSSYLSSLKRYFDLFARSQIRVILFEEMIEDLQGVVDDLTEFLMIDRFEINSTRPWSNRTRYTSWPGVQRRLNAFGKHLTKMRHVDYLRVETDPGDRLRRWLAYAYIRGLRLLLPEASEKPKMHPETRRFLTQHLEQRNRGLSDLLERDLSEVWKGIDV